MPELVLGMAVLVGILVMLRLFMTASPSTLATGVRYAGVGVLGLAAAGLFYIRNVGLGFVVAGMAWGLYTKGHIWPTSSFNPYQFSRWGRFGYGIYSRSRAQRGRSAGSTPPGQTSRVDTAWVAIELDHDTGEMQGQILHGVQTGRALATLSPEELIAFYQEAAPADAETGRLLEAYLDRRLGPEWRLRQQQKTEEEPKPRGRADSGMSRDEALRVLGLSTGASEDDIRAAHKKLMMQNHPDRGGTDYLAAKINEAKDVLIS